MPAAITWSVAAAGVVLTAFAFREFPALQAPPRMILDAMLLARLPGDHMVDAASGHRILSSVVVLAIGAGIWTRRARA